MMLKVVSKIILHLKYGSGVLLAGVGIILLLMLTIDVWKIISMNLKYFDYVHVGLWSANFRLSSLFNFSVLFLLPIVFVLMFNYLLFRTVPKQYFSYAATSTSRALIIIFHFIVVLLCTSHYNIIPSIKDAAGYCGALASKDYCFTSAFDFLESYRGSLGVSLAFFILVQVFYLVFKEGLSRGKEVVENFEFWLNVGSVGEYQPVYGDEIIYVNTASMAPSIRCVNIQTQHHYHKYQRAVPTSDEARVYLKHQAINAKQKLQKYLFKDDERLKQNFLIEFFPGTSRALEAGILRKGDINHVILSQYEHPSQVDVIKWLCVRLGVMKYDHILPPSSAFFEKSWDEQKRTVVDSIKTAIGNKAQNVAVILSEVHYLTGMHIPVIDIINELKQNSSEIMFIVDGSQAVGNIDQPFVQFSEAFGSNSLYYFSAHKWLYSPNTCGVLISHTNIEESNKIQPYDVFGAMLPTSTIDPNTIFGLSSSMEFLFNEDMLFKKLSLYSTQRKEIFQNYLIDKNIHIRIIKCATDSLNRSQYLCVGPSFGYKWKHRRNEFWDQLRKNGIDLTLIPEQPPYFRGSEQNNHDNPSDYVLRISFPYFLLGRNVRSLVRYLGSVVEPVN